MSRSVREVVHIPGVGNVMPQPGAMREPDPQEVAAPAPPPDTQIPVPDDVARDGEGSDESPAIRGRKKGGDS